MTIKESIARAHNLVIVSILMFGGLGFFGAGIDEKDAIDKVDDFGLLALGIIALIWYWVGRNRFKLSAVPMSIAILAAVLQIVWIFIENDDPSALGDNIGGMTMYGILAIFSIIHCIITKRLSKEHS